MCLMQVYVSAELSGTAWSALLRNVFRYRTLRVVANGWGVPKEKLPKRL